MLVKELVTLEAVCLDSLLTEDLNLPYPGYLSLLSPSLPLPPFLFSSLDPSLDPSLLSYSYICHVSISPSLSLFSPFR